MGKGKKRKKDDDSSDEDSSGSASDSGSPDSSSNDSEASDNDSDDEGSDGDSSDSDDDKKKSKKKKEKKAKKSKDKKKSKKKKKDKDKKKSKKKKKDKKKKKKKKKDKEGGDVKVKSFNDSWGKYGTVHENDRHAKSAEYYAWLMEVKHISRETLSQREEREMFRDYCEDYNTGTFPSTKYYNLAAWQAEQASKKANKGGGGSVFDMDPSLTDEDRVRLERQQAKREQIAQAEMQAVIDLKNKMKAAKAANSSEYYDLLDRQREYEKGATFESIAKAREAKRRAKEEEHRRKHYGIL